MLSDAVILEKNVVLLKGLAQLDANKLDGKGDVFVDVWPADILSKDLIDPDFDFDDSGLFLLQLAALLSRSARWRKNTKLRILVPVGKGDVLSMSDLNRKMARRLDTFRIKAEIILAQVNPG